MQVKNLSLYGRAGEGLVSEQELQHRQSGQLGRKGGAGGAEQGPPSAVLSRLLGKLKAAMHRHIEKLLQVRGGRQAGRAHGVGWVGRRNGPCTDGGGGAGWCSSIQGLISADRLDNGYVRFKDLLRLVRGLGVRVTDVQLLHLLRGLGIQTQRANGVVRYQRLFEALDMALPGLPSCKSLQEERFFQRRDAAIAQHPTPAAAGEGGRQAGGAR